MAMMLSTNRKNKRRKQNKNTIIEQSLNLAKCLDLPTKVTIEQNHNYTQYINLPADLINEIVKYLSFQDRLSLRLANKKHAINNKLPQILYDRYYKKNKYTPFPCAFFDLINNEEVEIIKLLLQNSNKPLPFLSYRDFSPQSEFIYLHPINVINNNVINNKDCTTSTKELFELLQRYPNKNYIDNENIYLHPNDTLCLASCVGNIQTFKNEYFRTIKTDDKNQKEINERSIPLVIWIATQNCDINFLTHLLQYDEYKTYIHDQSDKFLTLMCTGPLEDNFLNFYNQPAVTKTQFEKIKYLIDSNIFNLFQRDQNKAVPGRFMAVDCIRLFYSNYQPQNIHLKNIYQYISTMHQQKNIQEIEKNLKSNNTQEWILSYLPWNYTQKKINFWQKLQEKFYDTPYLLNNLTTKDEQRQWLDSIDQLLIEFFATYHQNLTVDEARIIEDNYDIIKKAFQGLPDNLKKLQTKVHTILLNRFYCAGNNHDQKMFDYCYRDRSSLH